MAGSFRMWIKGQDMLLRAAARLAKEGGEAPWVMLIGKGEDMDKLKSLAQELGVSGRTAIVGYQESLARPLAACDALAFPSLRSEGTSRVLFECLASGRPVAASRVGCVDEIVRDGREGILVPPGDDAALARALAELRADPARARRMGESARRRAEVEFDRRVMAKRFVEIYRAAAREREAVAA